MYLGEVSVAQDDIDGFLKAATELAVKGIGNPQASSADSVVKSSPMSPKRESMNNQLKNLKMLLISQYQTVVTHLRH